MPEPYADMPTVELIAEAKRIIELSSDDVPWIMGALARRLEDSVSIDDAGRYRSALLDRIIARVKFLAHGRSHIGADPLLSWLNSLRSGGCPHA